MNNHENLEENKIYVFEKDKSVVVKIRTKIFGENFINEKEKNGSIQKAKKTIIFLKYFGLKSREDLDKVMCNSQNWNDEQKQNFDKAQNDKTKYPIIYIN